jgi:hypothetical protein
MNVNDPPHFSGASVKVLENAAQSTPIGPPLALNVTDQDYVESFTWTILSGGEGAIDIDGISGQLLQLSSGLDYEAVSTYDLVVQVCACARVHVHVHVCT